MNTRRIVLATLAAVLLPPARAATTPSVPDVRLLDSTGTSVGLRELTARHTVALNFIYTGCSSFCPPQTAVFRAVQARLAEVRGPSLNPLLLSLSIDPLNDSPSALARYASRFEARLGLAHGWLMLTGETAAIARTTRAFNASVIDPAEHPAQLWVGCEPKGRWLNANALAAPDDVLLMMRRVSA